MMFNIIVEKKWTVGREPCRSLIQSVEAARHGPSASAPAQFWREPNITNPTFFLPPTPLQLSSRVSKLCSLIDAAIET
jgi:hypothetical protein